MYFSDMFISVTRHQIDKGATVANLVNIHLTKGIEDSV